MLEVSTAAPKPVAFHRSSWLVPGLLFASSALAFASAALPWVELRPPVFSADHHLLAALVSLVLLGLAVLAVTRATPRWALVLGAASCVSLGAFAVYDMVTGHHRTFDAFASFIRDNPRFAQIPSANIVRQLLDTWQIAFHTGAGLYTALVASGLGLIACALPRFGRAEVSTGPIHDRRVWLPLGLFAASWFALGSAATSWIRLSPWGVVSMQSAPRPSFVVDHRMVALGVGIVLLLLAIGTLSTRVPTWAYTFGAVSSLALAGFTIYDLATSRSHVVGIGHDHIADLPRRMPYTVMLGFGVYLAIATGLLGLIACVVALNKRPRAVAAAVVLLALTACTSQRPSGERPSIPPPDDPSKVPTWLTITCDKSGTESISGQYVQAKADGVHLKLVDEHGKASWFVNGDPPAQYSQSCSQPNWCDTPPGATAPGPGAACVWYRVVDPHGYYIDGPTWTDSRHTGCAVINSVNVRGRSKLQPGGTLESVIRQQVAGLAPSDQIRLVGYTLGNPRMYTLTRHGGFLAEVGFRQLGADQWEWDELLTCNDERLTWSPA